LPIANFEYDVNQNSYTFTNLSENADTYLWNFGDGTESSESDPIHIYSEDGDYNISLWIENQCAEDSYSTQVNITTIGLAENKAKDLKLYPNPSNGKINISGLNTNPYDVRLIDLTGRVLIQKSFEGQSINTLDLSRFNEGAYHIIITQGEQSLKQKLILHK